MLSKMFCGCQIAEACEGDVAVQKMVAEDPQFDLVFMDIEMREGLNGDVAVKMFRGIEAVNGGGEGEKRTHVVMISSEKCVKVDEFGADLFVQKPITPQKLNYVFDVFKIK